MNGAETTRRGGEFTEGPPRYYQPISSKGPTGWTFGGPMGYEEIRLDYQEGKGEVMHNQNAHAITKLSKEIIYHNRQAAKCARWIARIGCNCEVVGGVHLDTCPVQIAYEVSRQGLYQKNETDAAGKPGKPSNPGRNIRHLAEPFVRSEE